MRALSRWLSAAAMAAALAVPLVAGPVKAQEQSILNEVLQRGTLRVAIIGGNPPYSEIDPSGTPTGYDIEIAERIAATLNVTPEFIITDIPGRVASLQTRKADLTIASFTSTVERSTVIAFTDPYLVVGLNFVVRADSDIASVDDLGAGKAVAITRGGTAEDNVPPAVPDAEIVRFDNVSDTVLALDSGQVDAISQDNLFSGDLVAKFPDQYKLLPGIYSYEELSIGLPAGDFDWWRVVNLWVKHFNASGENARVFEKYFGYAMPPIQVDY